MPTNFSNASVIVSSPLHIIRQLLISAQLDNIKFRSHKSDDNIINFTTQISA